MALENVYLPASFAIGLAKGRSFKAGALKLYDIARQSGSGLTSFVNIEPRCHRLLRK